MMRGEGTLASPWQEGRRTRDEGDASVPSLHPLHSHPYGNHHPSSFFSSFFLDLTPLRRNELRPYAYPFCKLMEPVLVFKVTVAPGLLPTSPRAVLPVTSCFCTFTSEKSLLIEPVSVDASTWKDELAGSVALHLSHRCVSRYLC